MAWSCRSHSPPWSQIGQSSGWLMSRNSITPSRAFFTMGERVLTAGGSPFGPGRQSRTPQAHEATGLGEPASSTRHIRQLPAIESRSWKQKRGISAPAASHAWSSVYSGGTSTSVPSTMILVTWLQSFSLSPGKECGHADPPYRGLIRGARSVKLIEPGLKEAALVNGSDETGHFEIEQS